MSRSNFPEHTRRKAIFSIVRCFASIFAWILKDEPGEFLGHQLVQHGWQLVEPMPAGNGYTYRSSGRGRHRNRFKKAIEQKLNRQKLLTAEPK